MTGGHKLTAGHTLVIHPALTYEMTKQLCNHANSRKAREFEKREKEILATALDRFHSDDWESVTVAQIAQQVGIAKGTMYLHFSSKHEIYARLALDFYRALSLHLSDPLNGNALEQLRQLITRAFEFHLERPAYRRVTQYCEREDFRCTVKDEIATELDDIDRHIEKIINAVLLSGIQQGHVKAKPLDQLILCLQCTFQGALTRFWCNRHGEQNTPGNFVTTVTDYMLDTINNSDEPTVGHNAPEQQTAQTSRKNNPLPTTGNILDLTT